MRRRRSGKARWLLALAMVAFSLITYCSQRDENEVTGETQYVDLTPKQEIALGLQAAPDMVRQFGGLHPDSRVQALADRVGQRLVTRTVAGETPYRFEFHVLADNQTLNAFALPGGQVFVTAALMNRLETLGELAAVLGHEVGHVIGRHGAEQMAKAKLTQGLTGAAVLATSSRGGAQMAALIGRLINMKYGREDEIESDRLGVRLTSGAGYDPRSMIRVMEVLRSAAGGARQPEFFSTHPDPDRRIERIQAAIQERYPNGVPAGLES